MKIKCLPFLFMIVNLLSCSQSDEQRYQGYVEGETIFLASPYSGVLVDRMVNRGQEVKKGDLLYRLDKNPEAIVVEESEAELLQAKKIYEDLKKPRRVPEITAIQKQIEQVEAQLELAQIRVQRYQKLYNKNATDKDTLDETEARLEELQHLKAQYQSNLELAMQGSRQEQINAQQAKIDGLIAKLKQAKWQLAQKSVYAPVDGVVFDTYFRKGEFVNRQPVVAILPAKNRRIEFFVPVGVINRFHLDQTLSFTCDGCGEGNQAVINYISPKVEYIPPLVYSRENMDKLVFRLKAAIKSPAKFKPGQPVMITGSDHGQ